MDMEYTYWQGDGWLVGYLNDFPQYKTQGKTIGELEEMLLDVYENIQIKAKRKTERVLKTGKIQIPA
jgi:predicted RNase H-like HicB family nuclease